MLILCEATLAEGRAARGSSVVSILEAYNMPFAAALVLMTMLAVIQVIGLADMLGDHDVGTHAGAHADISAPGGLIDGMFSLIGLGRLPLMVWLPVALGLFAALGVSIQALSENLLGTPLNRWAAAAIAAVAGLPLTGLVSRPLARILPHDETTAVSTEMLLGRRGVITDGTARAGSPARARVHDLHGQAHHVMVEPHETGDELAAGAEVLLVRREAGTFFATGLAHRQLSLD